MVTRCSRSTPNSYLRLVRIWQVSMSSCGKFMQRLETCLLIAESARVLFRLISLCFIRLFALDLQIKYICYQKSFVIFILFKFLLKKCFAWEKVIENHRFQKISFSSYLTWLDAWTASVPLNGLLAASRLVSLSKSDVCLFVFFLFFGFMTFHEVERCLCRHFAHVYKIWDNDLT